MDHAKDFLMGLWAHLVVLRLILERQILMIITGVLLLSIAWGFVIFRVEYVALQRGISLLFDYFGMHREHTSVYYVTTVLSSVFAFVFSIFTFRYTINIICSPWLSLLSQRVETTIGQGNNIGVGPRHLRDTFWSSFVRSVRLNLRNFLYEMVLLLLLFLLSFLPWISGITLIGMFLVQAWFAGWGSLDFALERSLDYRESLAYAKRHPGVLLSIGGWLVLLLALPIVGWTVAPVWSVIAATHAFVSLSESHSSSRDA